jgi:hypothetical protein
VVDWCFCGGFREFLRANVVSLHGKRGEVVVICMAECAAKSWRENTPVFLFNSCFSDRATGDSTECGIEHNLAADVAGTYH